MTTTTTVGQANDARLLITIKEAADRLAVSVRTLYTLLDRGELRSVKLDHGRRVVVASLYEYVERHQS